MPIWIMLSFKIIFIYIVAGIANVYAIIGIVCLASHIYYTLLIEIMNTYK